MVNFVLSEVNAITRIGALAQECIGENSFGQIITSELLALLNSASGVFIEFEQSTEEFGLISGTSYIADHGYMDSYLNYYHRLDPVLNHYKAHHQDPSSISTTDQVIHSTKAYLESEFYKDFLAQTGIHHAMIFGLSADAHPFGLIGLHREKTQGIYSEKDRAIIQLVMPYLSLALQFRQEKRKQMQNAMVMSKLLTNSRICGYLVLDEGFVLQSYAGDLVGLINPSDDAIIAQGTGTNIFRNISEKLKLLLLKIRSNHRREILHSPSRFSETLTGQDLRVEPISHEDGSTQYLCLSISGSNALLSTPRMEACHLTGRQMDVTRLVSLGMTNSAIAEAIGISPKTVENYLTAIYKRTGATNKAGLISLLSN